MISFVRKLNLSRFGCALLLYGFMVENRLRLRLRLRNVGHWVCTAWFMCIIFLLPYC